MKKHTYLVLLLFLFVALPSVARAECSEEEKQHFEEIKDKYTYTYEINKDTGKYTIRFHMPEPERFAIIMTFGANTECKDTSDQDYECYNIEPGKYMVAFIGMTAACDETLKLVDVNLSKYNNYSDDPLCEGVEEFVLCQPTYDKEIDYDTFVSRVNTYKKTKEKQKEEEKAENNNNEIGTYIENNLFQIIIIGTFVVTIIITIILTTKTIKKSRRLE